MYSTECDTCWYYDYDEEEDTEYCSMDLDEDEMRLFIQGSFHECPYFQYGDEYRIVRKQM